MEPLWGLLFVFLVLFGVFVAALVLPIDRHEIEERQRKLGEPLSPRR